MRIPRAGAALVAGVALAATPAAAFCNIPGLKDLFGGRGGASAAEGFGASKTIFEYTVRWLRGLWCFSWGCWACR